MKYLLRKSLALCFALLIAMPGINASATENEDITTEASENLSEDLSEQELILGTADITGGSFASGASETEPEEDDDKDTEEDDKENVNEDDDKDTEEDDEDKDEDENLLELNEHNKFISGFDDGFFKPDDKLTRAQAAVIMHGLLKDKNVTVTKTFPDVKSGSWYADAVNALASLKIISGDDSGSFRPDDPIVRGEFVTMAGHFFKTQKGESEFTDIGSHWAKEYINSASLSGWISGYDDGTFRPANNITRAESVSIVNNMLGRQGDKKILDEKSYVLFPDVIPGSWYYATVMETAVEHSCKSEDKAAGEDGEKTEDKAEVWDTYTAPKSKLEPGSYIINGYRYLVTKDQLFAYGTTIDGMQFDKSCHYTSGDTVLDKYLRDTIISKTSDGDSSGALLKKLYEFTRDNFSYLGRPYISKDSSGWENARAIDMFKTGNGNCYSFAAVFYSFARYLDYPCKTVIGTFANGAHSWVEMEPDSKGNIYVCDPQLDNRYRSWGNYDYNFYMAGYSSLPDGYLL